MAPERRRISEIRAMLLAGPRERERAVRRIRREVEGLGAKPKLHVHLRDKLGLRSDSALYALLHDAGLMDFFREHTLRSRAIRAIEAHAGCPDARRRVARSCGVEPSELAAFLARYKLAGRLADL